MTIRIGTGYDVHAFTEGRPLILGGIVIPHTHGLAGHSDADTVIHAIVDALLGAAALGDIGTHFPSSDKRWAGQPSTIFLTYAAERLRAQHWHIINIDATIIAEHPKLSPYSAAMRAYLAEHLHLAIEQVSIKAKTTDGLGFTGRREGIACQAVALIETLS